MSTRFNGSIVVILCSLLLISVAGSSIAKWAPDATITGDGVRIRSGPGKSFSVIGSLNRDDKVEVLDSMGEWRRLKTSRGVVGWVHGDYMRAMSGQAAKHNLPVISGGRVIALLSYDGDDMQSESSSHKGYPVILPLAAVRNGRYMLALEYGERPDCPLIQSRECTIDFRAVRTFTIFRSQKKVGTFAVERSQFLDFMGCPIRVGCGKCKLQVEKELDKQGFTRPLLALSGPAPEDRDVPALETGRLDACKAELVRVVANVLKKERLSSSYLTEPVLNRILVLDLEGDGVPEVCGVFEQRNKQVEVGPIETFICVTFPRNDTPRNLIVLREWGDYSPEFRLIEALDLDDDGITEIVLMIHVNEGVEFRVLKLKGEALLPVLKLEAYGV
jgi:uncharacterized protein YgiM (DUF1202 family)